MTLATRDVRLTAVRYVADRINLFEFTPVDGAPPEHLGPGTHIDIELQEAGVRPYSLAELRADAYVIAVQREPAGRGGSAHLHERARVGDRFRIAGIRNLFVLDETARHTVLIAGGIGITPILPMLERLNQLGASWELHYAVRTGPVPFLPVLRRFGQRVAVAVRDAPGYRRLDIEKVVTAAPPDATFYCCGPEPMLAAFASATAGVAEDRVHVEHFAPVAPVAAEGGFAVSLAKLGREIAVRPGQTILEALLEAGIEVPHSCQQGICGACETAVLAGQPDHRDGILSPSERAAGNTMMICCSGSLGPRLVLDR